MTAPGLSEQELAEIDYAVAKAEGMTQPVLHTNPISYATVAHQIGNGTWVSITYEPTLDPAEAMRLQAKYLLTVGPRTLVPEFGETQQEWYACALNSPFNAGSQIGPTPCIAICRAVIAIGAPK